MKLKRLLQSACTRDGTRIGIVATYAQLFLYNGSGRSCAAGTALAAHRGRRTRCRLRAAPEPLWQGANPDVVIAVCVKHKQHSADEHFVAATAAGVKRDDDAAQGLGAPSGSGVGTTTGARCLLASLCAAVLSL